MSDTPCAACGKPATHTCDCGQPLCDTCTPAGIPRLGYHWHETEEVRAERLHRNEDVAITIPAPPNADAPPAPPPLTGAELTGIKFAIDSALSHILELEEAWRVGALCERDGLGGMRSNRNIEVRNQLRAVSETLPRLLSMARGAMAGERRQ